MRLNFEQARDAMTAQLQEVGYAILPAEGTYFLSVDLAASGVDADDVTFCERAVCEAGVAAIPVSAFYEEEPVRNVIRLCFAKQPETISAGVEQLRQAKALFAR
jgi:aspartate/methionine/tyrosine aminotransferase